MTVKVFPSRAIGSLQAPSSKSCTQRALAAALIRPGLSIIENAGRSNDELAARSIVQSLGAEVKDEDGILHISTPENVFSLEDSRQTKVVSCGESGLSMRMFAPIIALFSHEITLTGTGSILSRPMDFLDEHLPPLGVTVNSNNGKVPVRLRGPLHPANITVDGSLSSQYLTGLLFAFCAAATGPVTISVKELTSRPYIDLTISVLAEFGFPVVNHNYESFDIVPASGQQSVVRYTVEGDWSNAAFLLVAGAISGDVTLAGMNLKSTQADRRIMNALYDCGANVDVTGDMIRVRSAGQLRAFTFDATQCPDLFPPLVALAANCHGVSKIAGVHRLAHKESDRAAALQTEFSKMKVRVEFEGDTMKVFGTEEIAGAKVSSHNDHRIAMAAAVAALNAKGVMEISEADAVKKSYPGFYDDMRKIGVEII